MTTTRRLLLALGLLATPPAALAECAGADWLAGVEATRPGIAAGLDAAVAEAPFAEGRFFRIERDGRVAHLFGTYHSPDPAIAVVPPGLEAALAGARLLLVEIGPEERAKGDLLFAANPGRVLALTGPKLADDLAPGEIDRLAAILKPFGMTPQVAAAMQPWFLNTLLATPPCVVADLAKGRKLLDDRIADRARALGLAVKGLETIDASLAIFEAMPREDQIRLLRMNIAFADFADALTVTTSRFYREERILAIWELNSVLARELGIEAELAPIIARFRETALTNRNRAWLPAIRAAAAEGGAVIAVGALHLSGPDGLLASLAAEGWTVTRLPVS